MDKVKVEQATRRISAIAKNCAGESDDTVLYNHKAIMSDIPLTIGDVKTLAHLASQPVPAPDLVERVQELVECAVKGDNPAAVARAIIPIIQADEREECDLGAKPSVLVGQIAARFGLVVTDDPDFDHDDETFEKALVGFVKELSELAARATAIRERNG